MFMPKSLSQNETRELIDSYVRSYGQRGASKRLSELGYRSPEGHKISQGHVTRIMSGSETCLIAPSEESKMAPGEPPEFAPEASLSVTPKHEEPIATPLTREAIEKEEARRELHTKTRKALREELLAEVEAEKLRQSELSPLVPGPNDHAGEGHAHLQELARVHAVFSPRANIELEEDSSFFMIPRLKRKPVEVRTRPHEVRHFGSISLSTRDLNARQKE